MFARGLLCATAALVAGLALPSIAAASPGSTGGGAGSASESALQLKAQELEGQIQADGLTLDELDQDYDAAVERSAQLTTALAAARAAETKSEARLDQARQLLVAQAVMAYVTGTTPLSTFESGVAGYDPSLTVVYGDVVSYEQHKAVASYGQALINERSDSSQLSEAQQAESANLAQISSDRAAGARALAAEQQALGQVKGQLATLVAQVQAEQQAAVKASLASQNQLPPTGSSTAGPSTTGPSTTGATTPAAQTTADPTTQPPVGQPTTTQPTTQPTAPAAPSGVNQPAAGWQTAIAFARAQLGRPYQWGGTGPDSYDCSGLTMKSWAAAGVTIPRVAQDQYDATERIAIADLLPGDLVFFGTSGSDVSHVGIYIGDGDMIDSPETGQDVSIQSIYWPDLVGGGRVVE